MAFIARRFISSTPRLWSIQPSVAIPAPVNKIAVLSTPELRALSEKAQGPWKNLSNEDKVMLYRATFPVTFKEIKSMHSGRNMKVFIGVTIGCLIGAFLASFLRKTIGPTIPDTVGNKQWEADTRAKLIRQKANPIEGISSKV